MKKDWLKASGMHDGAVPEIFRNAEKLRSNATETVKLLWQYLKSRPYDCKFRRQHPINCYVLDFYCHQKRLSIEIDGHYHENPEQKEKDKDRTAYLKSVGILELRFKNQEIINEIEKVKTIIKSYLKSITHRPV